MTLPDVSWRVKSDRGWYALLAMSMESCFAANHAEETSNESTVYGARDFAQGISFDSTVTRD